MLLICGRVVSQVLAMYSIVSILKVIGEQLRQKLSPP